MDGVMGVPQLTGVQNQINSWYTDIGVLHQICAITHSRETKWNIVLPKKMWGIRHRFLGSTQYLEKELAVLDIHNRPVGMMVGTQEINWSNIPPADHPPSQLISNGSFNIREIKNYNKDWKMIIDDPDVAKIGNQIMVFDFDDPIDLRKAFDDALDLYNYLRDQDIYPSFIFSGNKGFHIWVHPEDIQKLTPVDVMTKYHTLQSWGQLLAGVVREIVAEVLGSEHWLAQSPPINNDLSPNWMQGLVRCPYSIHEKSGQIVWPLDQEDITNLELNLEEGSLATDVAGLLHDWVSCFPGYSGKLTHHPPHNKMYKRTLDSLRCNDT